MLPAPDDIVLGALMEDDGPCGDLTTGAQGACPEFQARQVMAVCAGEEALRISGLAGAPYTAAPKAVQVPFLRP